MSDGTTPKNDLLTRAWTKSRELTVRLAGSDHSRSDEDNEQAADVGKPLSECVVASALYEDGHVVAQGVAPDQLFDMLEAHPASFVWIGLHEPSHAALQAIADELNLPSLAVEDAVHAHQRPKVEDYGNLLFVAFRSTGYVDSIEVITTGEVMAFVGERFIITVRHGDIAGLSAVRRRLEAVPELLRQGPGAVLYAVADHVVDGFGNAIMGLAGDADEVEEEVFGKATPKTTERLYRLKRECLELRRSVQSVPNMVRQLSESQYPQIPTALNPYFRDVEDHAQRAAENLATLEETLWGAVQANLALVAKQQNDDMRRLSAGAAIFAVLTLIVGVYGMNFDNMPELHWKYGYFIVLGVMALLSLGLYKAFRKAGWL